LDDFAPGNWLGCLRLSQGPLVSHLEERASDDSAALRLKFLLYLALYFPGENCLTEICLSKNPKEYLRAPQ
jgi:hypothetical protein